MLTPNFQVRPRPARLPPGLAAQLRRIACCILPLGLGASAALLLLLVAGGPARPVYAGTHHYPGCGASIQDCINSANAGDAIRISAGDYTEGLTLSKAVCLTGELSSTTILHALPNTRVLTVTGAALSSTVVISGLTFTGGLVTGTASCPSSCGGGIWLGPSARARLSDVRIVGNVANVLGGGLYADVASSVSLEHVEILNNHSRYVDYDGLGGGGAYIWGAAEVRDGLFQGNSGGSGGGLASRQADVTRSQFLSNTSVSTGGGLNADSLSMSDSQLIGNTGSDGGGAYAYYGAALENDLFEGNRANGGYASGGGIWVLGTLVATNTEFIDNSGGSGGGAHVTTGARLFGGLFEGNTAVGPGGGLSVYLGGHGLAGTPGGLQVTGTRFINNSASFGGGLAYDSLVSAPPESRIVNALFDGNSAPGGEGAAIEIGSPAGGRVVVLYSTLTSATQSSGTALLMASPGISLGVTDTIFSNYAIGISVPAGSAYEDYNLFYHVLVTVTGAVTSGGHSQTGDPVFLNPAAHNNHLGLGSAAIDAGADVGVPFDVDGAPRPYGPGFDIGYDEFTGIFNVHLPLVRR